MIKKIISLLFIYASIAFFIPALSSAQDYNSSDSGINSGSHGLHLRGALGAGQVAWGYLNDSTSRGDLGTGDGSNISLSAMYNFTLVGFEFNYLGGNIKDLEWTENDIDYKSTGSGHYNVYDWKLGAKLFTEPGDMGYTFIFMGKRYWNTVRKQDTREWDTFVDNTDVKYEAKGDGWIYGIRDFSTIGSNDGTAFVIQSGLYFGTAPVTSFKIDGIKQTLPDKKDSPTFGAELGAGVAFQNIGLSVIGGLRGEFNVTTYEDDATGDESVFGFGNSVFFLEAGMMF